MSITVIRTVHCDRCGRWTDAGLGVATGAEVRRGAKRGGWRVALPGGEDICPDCVAMETCTCGPHRVINSVMWHAPECPSQASTSNVPAVASDASPDEVRHG